MSIARKGGVRVLGGPNTLGLITPDMNATFAFADVLKGNVAVVARVGGYWGGLYVELGPENTDRAELLRQSR